VINYLQGSVGVVINRVRWPNYVSSSC